MREFLFFIRRLITTTGFASRRLFSRRLIELGHATLHLFFESSSSPQVASVVEHRVAVRVQGPVGAFARSFVVSVHFDKAVVERQVVADRVLPALFVLAIVGKPVHDELIDAVESDSFVGRALDRHGDESDVGVGRFDHVFATAARRAAVARPEPASCRTATRYRDSRSRARCRMKHWIVVMMVIMMMMVRRRGRCGR